MPEHLLDGVTLDYYYQNGTGVNLKFDDGKMTFEWIAGPKKGNTGTDISYRSKKIGDDMYVINFQQQKAHNFITLIGGIIERVKR